MESQLTWRPYVMPDANLFVFGPQRVNADDSPFVVMQLDGCVYSVPFIRRWARRRWGLRMKFLCPAGPNALACRQRSVQSLCPALCGGPCHFAPAGQCQHLMLRDVYVRVVSVATP